MFPTSEETLLVAIAGMKASVHDAYPMASCQLRFQSYVRMMIWSCCRCLGDSSCICGWDCFLGMMPTTFVWYSKRKERNRQLTAMKAKQYRLARICVASHPMEDHPADSHQSKGAGLQLVSWEPLHPFEQLDPQERYQAHQMQVPFA